MRGAMIPESWLQLLFFVFMAGVLLELPWMIYFAVAIIVVIWLAQLWRKHALDRVSYARRFRYKRGFPGEATEVQITVVNNKALPLSWLRSNDHWPAAVGPAEDGLLGPTHIPDEGTLTNLFSLRWFERTHRTYQLLFRQRGVYEVGPVVLEGGDFFGLYVQQREQDQHEYLTVYPEILPLEGLHLPAEDPFGERRARRPLFEDPNLPMGIRPYHPEDGFRHIHWQATARTGELQTRVFQPVTARTVTICLNIATEAHHWLGYSAENLEQLVKVCATLVYQGVEAGYAVGLFSNGCLAHADQPFRIQPGKSRGQLGLLLQALAGVTPYVNASFEDFLIRSMAEIPFGSTLVIVTAMLPESLQETLVRLHRYRPNILLVSLAKQPPPELLGIRSLHLPFEGKRPHD